MEPVKNDAGKHVVSYSITVEAPAAEIYALLADPHRHHEIDGSGTVRSSAIGAHELTEGARFSVRMRKFGIRYRLPLRVTRARAPEKDRAGIVEWRQPTGHRWRWEFAEKAENPSATVVTESYDSSEQIAPVRAALGLTGVNAENATAIKASLRRVKTHFESNKSPGQAGSS